MSDFSGYEKMPTSLKKLGLSESDFSELEKLKWVVTEKVHGANFSFVYDNGTLRFAKRKAYLSWTDDFFGFQLVVNKIESNITQLFEQLSASIPGNKYVVYGELFGGMYPHPEVAQDANVHAIQTGVYYAPSIEFCAFDIAVETDGSDSKYYLDYETALSYFEQHEITHAKSLFTGKFSEALNFDTRINSTVPALLNLPELKDNLIEGVVVKPFNQQPDSAVKARPIVKLKNTEFDEEKKFHEAEKWTYIPDVSSKTNDLSFIVDELRNYVTHNRLESAISKIGALDFDNPTRMEEIKSEFLRDTLADFNEDNADLLIDLTDTEQAWISNRVEAESDKLIQKAKQ